MLQCYIRKRGLRKERKEVGVSDGRKAIQISWERACNSLCNVPLIAWENVPVC